MKAIVGDSNKQKALVGHCVKFREVLLTALHQEHPHRQQEHLQQPQVPAVLLRHPGLRRLHPLRAEQGRGQEVRAVQGLQREALQLCKLYQVGLLSLFNMYGFFNFDNRYIFTVKNTKYLKNAITLYLIEMGCLSTKPSLTGSFVSKDLKTTH